jgi:chemotaxis protein MotB
MAGHGGGAWKVAYADFVTAMMAFFMVMWLTSQSQPVKEAIAQHFREPYRASKPSSDPASGPPFMKRASSGKYPPATSRPSVSEEAFHQEIRPRALRSRDGDRSHIGATLLFAEDSAAIDAAAEEALRQLAPQLAGKPQRIEIRGHSSRKPTDPNGPFPDAWRLCYARCLATMEFLKQLGIAEDRIRLSQAGKGQYAPSIAAPGHDVHGQEMQSRVDVFLLSEIVPSAIVNQVKPSPSKSQPANDKHAGGG